MTLNYARTAVLLASLTAILLLLGAAVGGQTGLVIAFAIALVMNAVSLWKSDTIVLRMFNAQEVNEATAPELFQLVRELARRADLPMPRVYVMNNPQPNAFATGRNPSHAAVCASTGLLEALNREELAGVLAHELAHVKNRDTLTMAVAATIGSTGEATCSAPGTITVTATAPENLQFTISNGVQNTSANVSGTAPLTCQ